MQDVSDEVDPPGIDPTRHVEARRLIRLHAENHVERLGKRGVGMVIVTRMRSATRMRSRANPSTRAIAQRFPDHPVQRRDGESPKPLNAITEDAEIGADLIAHGGQFETRNAALIDITIIRIHRSLPHE